MLSVVRGDEQFGINWKRTLQLLNHENDRTNYWNNLSYGGYWYAGLSGGHGDYMGNQINLILTNKQLRKWVVSQFENK